MRVLLTALAYVAVLAVVAAVAFFVVILLAGPHSDLLPGAPQAVVILLGWVSVLALPMLAARGVWRCLPPRGQ
jgi:hypothetical protein